MPPHSRLVAFGRWFYGQPYLLLLFTTLFWGGNVVAGKLAAGEVSPMAITFLRWFISCAALAMFARRAVLSEWRVLAPRWLYIVLMAGVGFTTFNALFYEAATRTTGVNMAIIQGSTPIFVLLGALAFGVRFGLLQMLGVLATIAGVALTASRGDVEVLKTIAFNRGDAWLLIASILYAGYTLALRWKPKTSSLVFFTAMAVAACVTSLPLLVLEGLRGDLQWPTLKGWLVLLYVALLPSLLCQIFYIRAIELIGPGRAGAFYNLVPVFGALLSTLILPEPFAAYHVAALALVLGGIALANWKGSSKAAP
ncbi:membrane protein [Alsobacter metallidurans]|uniref:Membrane protein n=1 Tax=Alsobacter metallidurans TaxID=340221 RepID=A0A917MIR1_9HYPH|nr:DMT family transporter [Alsobacter metallidurans]GGH12754.1 membrane protein [Alsobacter metallidurans]